MRGKASFDIIDFADHIQGLDAGVLHLAGAILALDWAIQGFEHAILKFMISKQFNVLVAKLKKTNWDANAAISVGIAIEIWCCKNERREDDYFI